MPLSYTGISAGSQAASAQLKQVLDLLTGVMTDQAVTIGNTLTATALIPSGLTGSVAATRWVGATTTAAPTTGAHLVGDWVTTQDGRIWICTVAGTPGTWSQPSPPLNSNSSNIQPVGTVAAAGAVGLGADAGHVHTGAGLTSASNVWTALNVFGAAALTGSMASAILQANVGALGGTAGNSTAPIASLGGTTTNQTELNVRLWREATGTSWTTAAIVLSMDVDSSYASGTKIALDANKFFGINTEVPGYLFDLFSPSLARVFHVDSSGNLNSDAGGYLSTSNYVQGARFASYSGNAYLDSVSGTGYVYFRTNNGGTNLGHFDNSGNLVLDQSAAFLYSGNGDIATTTPGTTQCRRLYNASNRPASDTGVLEGDVLFNA